MRLRRSSLLFLVVAGALAVTLACASTDMLLLVAVDRLQQREALANEPRLRRLVDQEAKFLMDKASDWAVWDAAYRYVTTDEPRFVTDNLVPETVRNLGITTIVYVRYDGTLIGQTACRGNEAVAPLKPPLPIGLLMPTGVLMGQVRDQGRALGLIATPSGPMLVAARQVQDSRAQRTAPAAVVMGRLMDEDKVATLANLLGRPVRMRTATADELPVELVPGDQDTIRVRLDDLSGKPLITAEIDQPRWMRGEIAAVLPKTRLLAAVVAALVVAVLWWALDRRVFRRLEALRSAVAPDPTPGSPDAGDDEIVVLGRTFDQALARERTFRADAAANEERYRQLFQQSAEAVLLVDDGQVADANRAALRLFGAGKREELIGQPYARMAGVERSGAGRRSSPSSELLERVMRRLDGRTLTAEVRESVIEMGGRRVIQVLARDIGERLRGEHERRLLASVLEATSDCVAVSGPDLRAEFVNSSGRRLLGLPGELEQAVPAADVDLASLVAAEHRVVLAEGVKAALTGNVWRGEVDLLTGSGGDSRQRMAVSWTLVAVGDGGGSPARLGSLIRDARDEQARRRSLEAASRAVVETARAKDAFLAIVSHELRTPLGGVIGMASLLQETPLREDQREFAQTIHVCATSLLSLINDILDLSKMEAGALELEQAAFDPRDIAEEAVAIVAERALTKGLEIGCLVDPLLPGRVVGDPTRLRQVLVNLLGNAVKFTERGEVLLRLEATASGHPNRAGIRFRCRDTGIGMSPEVQAQLFKPFTQANASTTRRYGGTGLGLAISQRLVELMGGIISVASQTGAGSEFAFDIALPTERIATAELPPDLTGITVLVVDPHPTARLVARTMLSGCHARVEEAASVAQAVAVLKSTRPTVVLASLDLPDGRAEDLAAQVTAAGGGIRLLCTAPITHRSAIALARAAGADTLLTKPLKALQVTQAVAGAQARRTTRIEASRRTPTALETVGPLTGKRILVAEDDPVNRQLLIRMLDVFGAEVTVACDGREALEALGQGEFDLGVVDCQMPEVDGLEVVRRRRADEAARALPRLPIVACTANVGVDTVRELLEVGFDDVLPKPFPLDVLRSTLRRALGEA